MGVRGAAAFRPGGHATLLGEISEIFAMQFLCPAIPVGCGGIYRLAMQGGKMLSAVFSLGRVRSHSAARVFVEPHDVEAPLRNTHAAQPAGEARLQNALMAGAP